jgi:hypothetical protein
MMKRSSSSKTGGDAEEFSLLSKGEYAAVLELCVCVCVKLT